MVHAGLVSADPPVCSAADIVTSLLVFTGGQGARV